MRRNLEKSIQEYQRKFAWPANRTGAGCFYVEDVQQIIDAARDKSGKCSLYELLYTAVIDALKAGFMVGLRYEQRRARQQALK